jgi:molybdate-binding protein
MKKIKIMLMIVFTFFACTTIVNAKKVLYSCEYYKEYTESTGSKETAVLCKIYNNYSQKCYVAYGKSTATLDDNSESIINWSKANGTSYLIKDYVKENNTCPEYLVLKLESGINGYEVHAATSKDEAEKLAVQLVGQRYVAALKNVKNTTDTSTTSNSTSTSEDLSISDVCTQTGVLKSFRFLGYLLFIAKILIPIILIITGSIDFGRAVVASNQDAVSKAAKTFATRIVAGVIVFLIPTVVNFVFNLLPAGSDDYSACSTCLFKPGSCSISNATSTTAKKTCSDYSATNCPTTAENGKSCKVIYDSWDTTHQYGACSTDNK